MYRRTQPYETYKSWIIIIEISPWHQTLTASKKENWILAAEKKLFEKKKIISRAFDSNWKIFFLNTYIYIRSNIRQFIMLIIYDARLRDFINTWKTLIVLFVGWKLKKLWQFISLMFIFPPILSLELADPNQGGQTKLGSESNLALRLDPDPTKIPGSEKLDSFL